MRSIPIHPGVSMGCRDGRYSDSFCVITPSTPPPNQLVFPPPSAGPNQRAIDRVSCRTVTISLEPIAGAELHHRSQSPGPNCITGVRSQSPEPNCITGVRSQSPEPNCITGVNHRAELYHRSRTVSQESITGPNCITGANHRSRTVSQESITGPNCITGANHRQPVTGPSCITGANHRSQSASSALTTRKCNRQMVTPQGIENTHQH